MKKVLLTIIAVFIMLFSLTSCEAKEQQIQHNLLNEQVILRLIER